MKKKIVSLFMVLVALVVCGFTFASAADNLPSSFVTDNMREIEYLEGFPIIVKTADNGKYQVYCMNMSATYDKNITFSKAGTVDEGYVYILQNRPNTGNADKDFYITQMAVWYYDDYLNNNNYNLESSVKKYIIAHKDTNDVAKAIDALLIGAKHYKENTAARLELSRDSVTFIEKDGYFESTPISLTANGLTSNIKYSLTGAPTGSKILKNDDGSLVIKVPVSGISEGKEITISLNVSSTGNKYEAYYYYNSAKYQKLLFQDYTTTPINLSDSIKMVVTNWEDEHTVKISKTDVTETNEVAGATLVVKDESGNVIDTWVSTTSAHELTLKNGKYSLSETIAPAGYRLSTTTINFMVDAKGTVYVKDNTGVYSSVDKVIMINELQDVVGIRKLETNTENYVSGAALVIKDTNGNVVKEFTSTDKIYYAELDPGYYTLSEVSAPTGYILSNEVIYFYLSEDGSIKVKNNNGEYIDSAYVTLYNTKESTQEVIVPSTSSSNTLLIISGIALLIGGAYIAKKTIKEC